MRIAYIIKQLTDFISYKGIDEIVPLLCQLEKSTLDDHTLQRLVGPLRLKLQGIMHVTQCPPLGDILYNALILLAQLSPLNHCEEQAKPIDPINFEPIPFHKKIYLSTGYLYHIDTISQWISLKNTDPCTGLSFFMKDLQRIKLEWPFLIAVQSGDIHTVRELLADEKTDPNQANSDGTTALYLACKKGDSAIVSVLLGDPRIQMNKAHLMAPFYIACKEGNFNCVCVLFYIACEKGNFDCLCAFLDVPG
ncbi:MAG: ankyrin repeat domain-containing protein, partial [Legionellaceae bacterium]